MSDEYGREFLSAVITRRARETPHRVFMSLARSADLTEGFEDLSYGRFAQAVDRCVFWLEATVGKNENSSAPRAIFASLPRHDLRAVLLILAAPKTGHQMYWSQPFGETDYMIKALAGMDCDTFLRPTPCPEAVEEVLRQHPLRTFDLPPLESWLSPHHDPHAKVYPYSLPTDPTEAAHQPIMIFQTSGTTAEPKPIVVRLGSASKLDTYHRLPQLGQQPWVLEHLVGQRVLSTFGWYQFAGFLFHVICAVYYDYVVITAPGVHDWSPALIEAAILHGGAQSCILYPAACVEFCLSEHRHRLPTLGSLQSIVYAGSRIPRWVGDTLSRYTQVGQATGSTEVSIFPQEMPRARDQWPYFRLHPQAGVEFRPYHLTGDGDGPFAPYHHMVVVRQQALEEWQAAFVNFPHLDEYPMGDLFERHSANGDLWLSAGRIADLFTLPDGRVLNPVPIEDEIAEDPAVLLAMICGLNPAGRLVVLLTPRTPPPPADGSDSDSDSGSRARFLDLVWPSIQRSFAAKAPRWACALLDRGCIAATPPGLPIQRTGAKWNVNRRKTLASHRAALEEAFGKLTLSGPAPSLGSSR